MGQCINKSKKSKQNNTTKIYKQQNLPTILIDSLAGGDDKSLLRKNEYNHDSFNSIRTLSKKKFNSEIPLIGLEVNTKLNESNVNDNKNEDCDSIKSLNENFEIGVKNIFNSTENGEYIGNDSNIIENDDDGDQSIVLINNGNLINEFLNQYDANEFDENEKSKTIEELKHDNDDACTRINEESNDRSSDKQMKEDLNLYKYSSKYEEELHNGLKDDLELLNKCVEVKKPILFFYKNQQSNNSGKKKYLKTNNEKVPDFINLNSCLVNEKIKQFRTTNPTRKTAQIKIADRDNQKLSKKDNNRVKDKQEKIEKIRAQLADNYLKHDFKHKNKEQKFHNQNFKGEANNDQTEFIEIININKKKTLWQGKEHGDYTTTENSASIKFPPLLTAPTLGELVTASGAFGVKSKAVARLKSKTINGKKYINKNYITSILDTKRDRLYDTFSKNDNLYDYPVNMNYLNNLNRNDSGHIGMDDEEADNNQNDENHFKNTLPEIKEEEHKTSQKFQVKKVRI